MYTVLLVDDQELFRDIARRIFEASGAFQVVGEAIDGVDAVDLYAMLSPDLVLVDVQAARMNGFEVTRRILQDDPGASVVLVSLRVDPECERAGREAGALGLIARRDLDVAAVWSLLETREPIAA
jgi:DNA-binding NarL/FixJ family response regulator